MRGREEPAQYALEGSIVIAGALVQRMRDNLGLIEKSADIETLARTVDDDGGIYFVPAFPGCTGWTKCGPKLSQELKTGNRNSKERLDSMTVNWTSEADLKMQRWEFGDSFRKRVV